MTSFRIPTIAAVAGLLSLASVSAGAQTFTTLYSFTGQSDGGFVENGVILNGHTLYGTTFGRGQFGYGTVYSVDAVTGATSVLHQFAGGADGQYAAAPMIYSQGVLYGTTENGGNYGNGTVYAVDAKTGAEAILAAFGPYPDGATPAAGLTLLANTLYGTTSAGGGSNNSGTVFSVNAQSGAEAAIYRFTQAPDGQSPYSGLAEIGDALYGTTYYGGSNRDGTIFKVDPVSGATSVVYSFAGGRDGRSPAAGCTAVGSRLFGTTYYGGKNDNGTVFAFDVKTGKERVIYRFRGKKDGFNPNTTLAYAKGVLYGTTVVGGTKRDGTLYGVNIKTDAHAVLHDFTSGDDGGTPMGGLIAAGGVLYGTTMVGGPNRYGTVFKYQP